MQKGKCQEKNLMEFYSCPPSDKCALFKLYAHGLLSVFDSTDVCIETF